MRSPCARMVEPVSVTSTMASTRPSADLGLGGAPGELDLHVDAALGEPALACSRPARSRSRAPRRSSGCLHRRVAARTTSTQRVGRRLAFEYTSSSRHHDVGVVLEDPVAAGDAGVERAALDVARHLLRAHQQAAERRVVDRWGSSCATAGRDLPAGAAEELDGGGLEAALGMPRCSAVIATVPGRLARPRRARRARPGWTVGCASARGSAMKLAELARVLGATLEGGGGDVEITGVAPLEEAATGHDHRSSPIAGSRRTSRRRARRRCCSDPTRRRRRSRCCGCRTRMSPSRARWSCSTRRSDRRPASIPRRWWRRAR